MSYYKKINRCYKYLNLTKFDNLMMKFKKFLGAIETDSCQSANISGVFLLEFNESRIEVYCEVEPDQRNK